MATIYATDFPKSGATRGICCQISNTICLHKGQVADVPCCLSQGPMQSVWKEWQQGSVMMQAPSPYPSRHTEHSCTSKHRRIYAQSTNRLVPTPVMHHIMSTPAQQPFCRPMNAFVHSCLLHRVQNSRQHAMW